MILDRGPHRPMKEWREREPLIQNVHNTLYKYYTTNSYVGIYKT